MPASTAPADGWLNGESGGLATPSVPNVASGEPSGLSLRSVNVGRNRPGNHSPGAMAPITMRPSGMSSTSRASETGWPANSRRNTPASAKVVSSVPSALKRTTVTAPGPPATAGVAPATRTLPSGCRAASVTVTVPGNVIARTPLLPNVVSVVPLAL